ncbi:unnamed protein product, partial [Cyprideis torosa]
MISRLFGVSEEGGQEASEGVIWHANVITTLIVGCPGTSYEDSSIPKQHNGHLSKVFGQLRSFLEASSPSLQRERQLRSFWVSDANSKQCYECLERFTTFRRRHHCRACGQVGEFAGGNSSEGGGGATSGSGFGSEASLTSLARPRTPRSFSAAAVGDVERTPVEREAEMGTSGMPSLVTSDVDGYRLSRRSLSPKRKMSPSVSPADSPTSFFGLTETTSTVLRKRTPKQRYHEEYFIREESYNTENSPTVENARKEWLTLLLFQFLQSRAGNQRLEVDSSVKHARRWSPTGTLPPPAIFPGLLLINWLVDVGKVTDSRQGFTLVNALLRYQLIEPIESEFSGVGHRGIASHLASVSHHGQHHLKPSLVHSISYSGHTTPTFRPDLLYQPTQHLKELRASFGRSSPRRHSSMSESSSNTAENKEGRRRRQALSPSADTREPAWIKQITHEKRRRASTLSLSGEEDSSEVDGSSSTPIAIRKSGSLDESANVTPSSLPDDDVLFSPPPPPVVRKKGGISQPSSAQSQTEAEIYEAHQQKLLSLMLRRYCLHDSWVKVLSPVVGKVVERVRPDVRSDMDDMDIRSYVRIKKIPSASHGKECALINGVVCSKSVSHKEMMQPLKNAKIMLLAGSISYERSHAQNKVISIDPVLMQEREYLKNCIGKILVHRPDVVLVEKSVSRLAQDYLREHRVILATHVKPSVMERVARMTGALIVPSIDAHLMVRPQLGTCGHFYLKQFLVKKKYASRTKTLLFIDGCPVHLGITILLQGEQEEELTRVKKLLSFMIFVSYSGKLEQSLVADLGSKIVLQKAEEEKKSKEDSVLPTTSTFRVDESLLTTTPGMAWPPPFLETLEGQNSPIRFFFSKNVYELQKTTVVERSSSLKDQKVEKKEEIPAAISQKNLNEQGDESSKSTNAINHPFLKLRYRFGEDEHFEELLCDFRACGNRVISGIQEHSSQPSTVLDLHADASRAEEAVESMPSRDSDEDSDHVSAAELSFHPSTSDCLDPMNHQRLMVSFSSYAPSAHSSPHYCAFPWVVCMDFYGRNDIPFGAFLERYCFRHPLDCPAPDCSISMVHHIRRFVHGNACVQILLKEIEPNTEVLPKNSWALSFAKYLHMRFHAASHQYRGLLGTESRVSCSHSLHRDHIHYLTKGGVVASFRWLPLRLREVAIPPPVVATVPFWLPRDQLVEMVTQTTVDGHAVFGQIEERAHALAQEIPLTEALYESVAALQRDSEAMRIHFREKVEDLQLRLTELRDTSKLDPRSVEKVYWELLDLSFMCKYLVGEAVNMCNGHFTDLNTALASSKKRDTVEHRWYSGSANTGTPIGITPLVPASQTLIVSHSDCPIASASNNDLATAFSVSVTDVSSPTSDCSPLRKNYARGLSEPPRQAETGLQIRVSSPATPSGLPRFGSVPASLDILGKDPERFAKSERTSPTPAIVTSSAISSVTASSSPLSATLNSLLKPSNGRTSTVSSTKSARQANNNNGTAHHSHIQKLLETYATPITSPFPASEHLLRLPNRVALIVESDPASIVSYALASSMYQTRLAEMTTNNSANTPPTLQKKKGSAPSSP